MKTKTIYNFTCTDLVLVEDTTLKPLAILPAKYKAIVTTSDDGLSICPVEYETDKDIPIRRGNFNINFNIVMTKVHSSENERVYNKFYLHDLDTYKKYDAVNNIAIMDIKNFTIKEQVDEETDIILLKNGRPVNVNRGSVVCYDVSKYKNIKEFSKIVKDDIRKSNSDMPVLKLIVNYDTPLEFILTIIKETIHVRDSIAVEIEYPDHIEYIEL